VLAHAPLVDGQYGELARRLRQQACSAVIHSQRHDGGLSADAVQAERVREGLARVEKTHGVVVLTP